MKGRRCYRDQVSLSEGTKAVSQDTEKQRCRQISEYKPYCPKAEGGSACSGKEISVTAVVWVREMKTSKSWGQRGSRAQITWGLWIPWKDDMRQICESSSNHILERKKKQVKLTLIMYFIWPTICKIPFQYICIICI